MKLCSKHWTLLIRSLTSRGMGHLISHDSMINKDFPVDKNDIEILIDDMNLQLLGKKCIDPLFCASTMTYTAILRDSLRPTRELLLTKKCPVCDIIWNRHLDMSTKEIEKMFLDYSAETMFVYCSKMGMLNAT